MGSSDQLTFSHSSPRRILAILDWDNGGSHALPFADEGFEVSRRRPDSGDDFYLHQEQTVEMSHFRRLIRQLTGARPYDAQLAKLVFPSTLMILGEEAYLC